jgi:hypothetical protein
MRKSKKNKSSRLLPSIHWSSVSRVPTKALGDEKVRGACRREGGRTSSKYTEACIRANSQVFYIDIQYLTS